MRRLIMLLCISTGSLFAQTAPDVERLLLPVTVHDLPGAFGTRWDTELWLLLSVDHPFLLEPLLPPSNCDPPCRDEVIGLPTNSSFHADFYKTHPGEPPGALLYVATQDLDNIFMSLRLRESNVNGQEVIQLPIVRERDFFAQPFHILSVPADTSSRVTLRIYGLEATPGRVRVRMFIDDPDKRLLSDAVYQLSVAQQQYRIRMETYDVRPAAIEINIGPYPPTTSGVRFEISALDGQRLWAFASVTNNLTQHVILRIPR